MRIWRQPLLVAAASAILLSAASWEGTTAWALNEEFPHLADAPYPAQHVNPRASDYIEAKSPTHVLPAWEALGDSMIAQPCVSGPEGNVYCTRGWDLGSGKCNLVALDGDTGSVLWEDLINGVCLLDEFAWITNPLVDIDGHVYAADHRQVVSFTSAGELRWKSLVPSTLPQGKPNNPFGLNLLPSGELVTATMGDGFVLVLDRTTGELEASPFNLPSEKQRVPATAGGAEMPEDFMDSLAGPDVGPVLWDVGLGASDYEVDNNVAVDTHTGIVFITGGAPAPNPANDGALWAVDYDPTAPASERLSVRFHITFPGPGGIATTPTVTKDGNFVLIGDNRSNFVAVDIPACLAGPPGSACSAFTSIAIGEKLGASVTVTPENRVYFALPQQGLAAYDVGRDPESGKITLSHVFTRSFPGYLISGVTTGFENVIWLGLTGLAGVAVDGAVLPMALGDAAPSTGPGGRSHFLVGVRPEDGLPLWAYPSGDFANVTMAADRRTLITNHINFLDELRRDHHSAGIRAWVPVH